VISGFLTPGGAADFGWNIFITTILILIAFPVLTAALLGMKSIRR
jgi:heme/copper-type cytochrome/quinol oxidase subunit 1